MAKNPAPASRDFIGVREYYAQRSPNAGAEKSLFNPT